MPQFTEPNDRRNAVTETVKAALKKDKDYPARTLARDIYEAGDGHGYSERTIRTIVQQVKRFGDNKQELHRRATMGEKVAKEHPGLAEYCEEAGLPIADVNYYWSKGQNFSVNVKNKADVLSYEDIKVDLIESLKAYSPKFPKIKRTKHKDACLLVVDPADVHVGKLARAFETGEEYNSQIAVQRVREGVQGILDKSAGFHIDKILFVGGNDILHIDTPRGTTTKGTPQDVDGMWYDNFLLAKQLYIEVLETLIAVADVHFVFNPSNHDYTNGFFLSDSISAWFRNCKNITFDVSIEHRKYYRYGQNLIGTTHGDGAKQAQLPALMSVEAKDWSDVKHRYIYGHHIHHKVSKDYIGVTFETLRSPSASDSYHHVNGYQHAPQAIEGFIHDKNYGQIARFTHLFA